MAAPDAVKTRALLAGAVIEAVVLDALGRCGGALSQLARIQFVELIDMAAAANIISARTQRAAHSVRDLRSFVHPGVELRETPPLRKEDADQAVALMNTVLADLR